MNSHHCIRPRAALFLVIIGFSAATGSVRAAPPEEGDCPAVSGSSGADGVVEDAGPRAIREGMVLDTEDLMILRDLVPKEIWLHREIFFHEGMQLEVGPCYRRYAVPAFFREATAQNAGRAETDKKGNLKGYAAGLPFPPDSIDPEAKEAGLQWAWNLALRYRGAGFSARFRITDFPTRIGGIETYEGKFYLLQTGARADLKEDGYHLKGEGNKLFAAGGTFDSPYDVRHLAWRQFRPSVSFRKYQEPDDIFVYVPTMRKARRSATSWVDGVFLPSYLTSGDDGGGGLATGSGLGGISGINPNAGKSIATSQASRRGLTGLTLRPNAYVWRFRGVRDVLAPINISRPGYPQEPNRNYGYSGLSLGNDRWDLRQAVVIEGAMRKSGETIRTLTVFVDYQTQQPLYWITRTDKRRILEIGILAHRYSGDVVGYPVWPNGTPASVFDPVAASFFNALAGAGGWRRESYDMQSIRFSDGRQELMTSVDALTHGY